MNKWVDTFSGLSVFVTGHTGFKGPWLCMWLNRLGAKVTGYALHPPSNPNNFTVCGISELLEDNYEADIRDETSLHSALKNANPDIIFHLAAETVVRRSYEIPKETFDVNVIGTANLLDGVRKLKKHCVVIIITSDKCYENREQVWGYRESDHLGGHDPYSASKAATELVLNAYQRSYFPPENLKEHGIKLASARAGNVIGGGDWTQDALIVDIVHALIKGEPVKVRNPSASRPWQHVLQAISGYLALTHTLLKSENPELCSAWNFGPIPGNEVAVRDCVELFLAEWGAGEWVDDADPSQPYEANTLRLSIDKVLWQLKWQPKWNIKQSLQKTVQWYKAYIKDPSSMRRICLEQIADYEASSSS